MNIDNFNKNFPSWENEFKKQEDNNKKEEIKIIKFTEKYPKLLFNDLKKQNNNYSTDDGCIHYLHQYNNQVYSYNFIDNEWMQHGKKYQQSLMDLF